jgi:TolB-like protein
MTSLASIRTTLCFFGLLTVAALMAQPAQGQTKQQILVMPFENVTRDFC